MSPKTFIPWYAKIIIKIILSRLPLNYRSWRRAGIFRHGEMNRPAYAYQVFRTHYDRVAFPRKNRGFVGLELGPGDSMVSAVISWSLNASCTYLVDVGRYIGDQSSDVQAMVDFLRNQNLPVPEISEGASLQDILKTINARYEVEGIYSLRGIPDSTVDFIWSQAVLEHVFRDQLPQLLFELRRILRPDGVCSHRIDLRDHLGGGLNHLRFSSAFWESDFIRRSGFYTNRIRCQEMLQFFEGAGFAVRVFHTERWAQLPMDVTKLAAEFGNMPKDDLLISGVDVVLSRR
jgi:SAM-dependent methyltransferase